MARSTVKQPVIDTTIYPTDDGMGEGTLQRFLSELLRQQLVRWFALQKQTMFVGANQFIYWKQFNPREAVAPDVYVMPGVSQSERPASWKVWETGIVPRFALEIVSRDLDKDYEHGPRAYADLGVDELVVFDPAYQDASDRVRWQVFRTLKSRGFVRVTATNADRVQCKSLGCWLRAVEHKGELSLRVASGPHGDELLPTDEEQSLIERARAEEARKRTDDERLRAEEARKRADDERARADRAEAELAKLRKRLSQLQTPKRRTKKD